MEEQQFCLKWDNHQSNLLDGFVDLLNNEYLCDVTLACDGLSLKAHKLVLATASAFFRELFLNNPCSHPIVILPELRYRDMKVLVDFIYYGQVNVSQDQLTTILKVANYLKIKGVQTKTRTNDESYDETNSPSMNISENAPNSCSNENINTENAHIRVTKSSLNLLENKLEHSAGSESDAFCIKSDEQLDSINAMDETECSLNVSYEINPLSMMEQSMTTESIMPEKSDEKQIITNCESEYEDNERSFMELTDDGNFSEVQNCHAYYNQELPSSKGGSHSNMMSEKTLLKLPLICSNCQYVMTTLSDAQSHLNTNPSCRTSQFQCPLCPKLFIWPATLVKHFREQHQGPGGTTRVTERLWYFCEVCRKPLLSKHALTLHRNKFHGHLVETSQPSSPESVNPAKRGRKQGTRVCRLCKRTFLSGPDYQGHMQNFHSLKNVASSESGSTFDSSHSLSAAGNESSSSQSSMSVSSVT